LAARSVVITSSGERMMTGRAASSCLLLAEAFGIQDNMSTLEITADAGAGGPVIILSGEADVSTTGMLKDALDAQILDGTDRVTVDLSALEFADSAAISVLLKAHLVLEGRGGGLVLASPQPVVARSLSLLQVDQLLQVRTQPRISTAGDETDA
jgi:anti-anti-sigma factor